MQGILNWLITLPVAALYAVLAITAAIENIFPPFPSDLVVAFGSFVVAQGGKGSLLAVFLATWFGNVGGAMLVYAAGRRFGAKRLDKRVGGGGDGRSARLKGWIRKYGMPAIFVSRFVPAVRAIVPGVAGAARLSIPWTLTMIALASGLWYGLITVVAFRVGSDWQQMRETIAKYSTTGAMIGGALLLIGAAVWWIVRRRRSR